MLKLPDAWTWDFWLADDGVDYHVFYLKASRALGDPERRHWNVTIGHSVSPDLVSWTEVADALTPGPPKTFDDVATWTGSIVRADDGTWHMFYTGACSAEDGLKQRIGLATSTDLHTWHKHPDAVLESDPRWYETLPEAQWHDEAWRDPWVFRDPAGNGWHMLLTARANTGPADQRGVIGHAISDDLLHWQALPPLSQTGAGFGHLEVPQVETVDGQPVLLFSCLGPQLADEHRARGLTGGTWCVNVDNPLGPYDTSKAVRLTDESLYSGRLIQNREGRWMLLAFRNTGHNGQFIGELTDPTPVTWTNDLTTLQTHHEEEP